MYVYPKLRDEQPLMDSLGLTLVGLASSYRMFQRDKVTVKEVCHIAQAAVKFFKLVFENF